MKLKNVGKMTRVRFSHKQQSEIPVIDSGYIDAPVTVTVDAGYIDEPVTETIDFGEI